MFLYVLAAVVWLLTFISIVMGVRKEGLRFWKSGRLWIEAALSAAALIIVLWTTHAQDLQSAQTALDIEKVKQTQKAASDTQRSNFEKQGAALEAAKKQAEAQAADSKQQLEMQKSLNQKSTQLAQRSTQLIEAQKREIELINRLTLNHNVMGIELSFQPNAERWVRIAGELRRMVSPEPDLPYSGAPFLAERDGDHWRIDFEPVLINTGRVLQTPRGPVPLGGWKKLPKVHTSDPKYKGFEAALDEACPGIAMEWGNSTTTELEPRQKDYPSAIYVSRNKIALVLRPPLISWDLNELRDLRKENKVTVLFYGRNYPAVDLPARLTLRSLDPALILDQTIQLNWNVRPKSSPPTYYEQMKPQMSGPHTLEFQFSKFKSVSTFRTTLPLQMNIKSEISVMAFS